MWERMITLILMRYGWKVRRKGWWYRFPFLPVPSIKVMIGDIYKFEHFLRYVGK
jgi:hypothetical protein